MENGYRKNARPRGTDEAEVIQVIHTRALVGRGTPEDLVRHLDQYWSFDGKLLAVYDPASARGDDADKAIAYARELGKPILTIHPDTLKIEYACIEV